MYTNNISKYIHYKYISYGSGSSNKLISSRDRDQDVCRSHT